MSTTPHPLPDYDAGVLAAELGIDPTETTSLRVHVEARWISVRWSGYKRISPAQLQRAIDKATAAAKAANKPARRRPARKAATS
jgi:hypothetical protein